MSRPSTSVATDPVPAPAGPPGVIATNAVYTIAEAKLRLGWTDSALRAAKRRGLRVLRSGKRCYLSGEEVRRYLESL